MLGRWRAFNFSIARRWGRIPTSIVAVLSAMIGGFSLFEKNPAVAQWLVWTAIIAAIVAAFSGVQASYKGWQLMMLRRKLRRMRQTIKTRL